MSVGIELVAVGALAEGIGTVSGVSFELENISIEKHFGLISKKVIYRRNVLAIL